MLGENPLDNPDYPRMINKKHYDRVLDLLQGEKIAEGGYGREESLQIAPTILEKVSSDAPVMQEEIFGPVLPVLTYASIEEAEDFLSAAGKNLWRFISLLQIKQQNREF